MLLAQRMIRINLLPGAAGGVRSRRRAVSLPAAPLLALGAAIGLLALVSTIQSVRIGVVRGEITKLEAEAREMAPLIRRIDLLSSERELTLRRLQVVEQLDRDRLTRVRMVDDLARRMPEHLWFTGFSEKDGAVSLTGVAFSNLTVAELIRSLERSVLFEQIDLVVSQKGTIDDREVRNFTLSGRRQIGPDVPAIEPGVTLGAVPAASAPAAGPAAAAPGVEGEPRAAASPVPGRPPGA